MDRYLINICAEAVAVKVAASASVAYKPDVVFCRELLC